MTKEKLLEIFPEISCVPDEETREKCIETWLDVIDVMDWDTKGIENCHLAHGLVSDDCAEKCIFHCRHVAQACIAYYDKLGEWIHSMGEFDENVFFASAVLHDVGKFLEYDYVDGKTVHTETGKMFRHVTSGAYYAKKHGLPDKVVYNILAHSEGLSPEHGNGYPSLELTVMRSLDFLTYSIAQMTHPAK